MPKLSHLEDYFGHGRSVDEKAAVWSNGTPVPWMTYPAINYLNQLDFSRRRVFEYGTGNSTIYWAQRARYVKSVEHDRSWHNSFAPKVPNNVKYLHATERSYVEAIREDGPYDVISVDGRWRFDCGLEAVKHIAFGGMIILDNSERYPRLTDYFRRHGLIQIDFIGYGPINPHPWATSMFLSRSFSFESSGEYQPRYIDGMFDSAERKPTHLDENRPGGRL